MNEEVDLYNVEIKDIPYRFETGTPPIAEAIGLGKALEFITEIGLENIEKHEKELHKYAIEKLNQIDGITIYKKSFDYLLTVNSAFTIWKKNNESNSHVCEYNIYFDFNTRIIDKITS